MTNPGSASGLITPVYPEDLGFKKGAETPDKVGGVQVGRHTLPKKYQKGFDDASNVLSTVTNSISEQLNN